MVFAVSVMCWPSEDFSSARMCLWLMWLLWLSWRLCLTPAHSSPEQRDRGEQLSTGSSLDPKRVSSRHRPKAGDVSGLYRGNVAQTHHRPTTTAKIAPTASCGVVDEATQ